MHARTWDSWNGKNENIENSRRRDGTMFWPTSLSAFAHLHPWHAAEDGRGNRRTDGCHVQMYLGTGWCVGRPWTHRP